MTPRCSTPCAPSATSTARTGPSRSRSGSARRFPASPDLQADLARPATARPESVFRSLVKLLASAAALVCVARPSLRVRLGGAASRGLRARTAASAVTAARAGGVRSRPLRTPGRFNLVGMRWRGRAEPEIERAGAPAGGAGVAGSSSRRTTTTTPTRARRARRRLGPALGGQRPRRPVPDEPARARAAAAFRARGRRRTRRRGREPPRRPAGSSRRVGVGRRRLPAAQRARLRRGEGRARAPHGLAQRLLARGGAGDGAGDLPLPPQLQRLGRHRLQRPRRQVRRALRGPRRRARQGGDRRPGTGLQRPDRRDLEHRRPHARCRRRPRARRHGPLHPLEAPGARPAALRPGHARRAPAARSPATARVRG